jgi:hypothetical protein
MEINMKLEQDEMEGVDSKEWVSGVFQLVSWRLEKCCLAFQNF